MKCFPFLLALTMSSLSFADILIIVDPNGDPNASKCASKPKSGPEAYSYASQQVKSGHIVNITFSGEHAVDLSPTQKDYFSHLSPTTSTYTITKRENNIIKEAAFFVKAYPAVTSLPPLTL
ncbi:MAG: hypothetical protein A2007_00815 [Verrucomicrobia bacterium GWC2_42_7]|nr:MAG: hypothetical protein A2007_00815 [Verrucomicrobia bacterium GWC2_42_7]